MTKSENQYSGLAGRIRLKKIKRKVKKLETSLQINSQENSEVSSITNLVEWNGASRLIFLNALKALHDKYLGLYDAGFVRLCKNWLNKFSISSLDDNLSTEMCKTVLPKDMFLVMQDNLTAKKKR